jgi:hypothetical protein
VRFSQSKGASPKCLLSILIPLDVLLQGAEHASPFYNLFINLETYTHKSLKEVAKASVGRPWQRLILYGLGGCIWYCLGALAGFRLP